MICFAGVIDIILMLILMKKHYSNSKNLTKMIGFHQF